MLRLMYGCVSQTGELVGREAQGGLEVGEEHCDPPGLGEVPAVLIEGPAGFLCRK